MYNYNILKAWLQKHLKITAVAWTVRKMLKSWQICAPFIRPVFSVAVMQIHIKSARKSPYEAASQSGCMVALLFTVSSSIVSQLCRTKCCLWLLLIGSLSPPCSYLISQARSSPTASQQQQRRNRHQPNHFVIQDASLTFFILITSCSRCSRFWWDSTHILGHSRRNMQRSDHWSAGLSSAEEASNSSPHLDEKMWSLSAFMQMGLLC